MDDPSPRWRQALTSIQRFYQALTSDDGLHPLEAPLRAIFRWGRVFYRKLQRDRAFVRAAAMAYTSLIAMVPLLLLVFGILHATGIIQRDPEVIETFLFETFVGDIREVRDFLVPGLMKMDLRALSLVGTTGLLFVAARLYMMVERAYNDIFGVPVRRGFLYRLLNFYFTLTAIPVILGMTLMGTVEAMGGMGTPWIREGIEVAMSFVFLLTALKLFPCTYVRWGPALIGAATSTVFLELGKRGFELYLKWFRTDDPLQMMYGSVGLIPVFLLWLYLLWIVILLGVEVAYVAQNMPSLMEAEKEQSEVDAVLLSVPSIDTALETATAVAWHFANGRGPADTDWIANQCGVSSKEVYIVLQVLETTGVFLESNGAWLMAKPVQDVPLKLIIREWRMRTTIRRTVEGQAPCAAIADDVSSALEERFPGNLSDAIQKWSPRT